MRRLTKKIPDPSLNQHTISFTYNPTGLPQVMDELVSGSVIRTYAYGLQRISENQLVSSTWTPSFYGYDGHGDVRLLTNTAGTVTDTYQYDAFGNQIASTGSTPNNFLFSGEQFDSSVGSLYLRARYYRLPTGRFLTMDPDEGSILNPATLHKYVYTRNNPVNAIDPTGRGELFEDVLIEGGSLPAYPGLRAVGFAVVDAFCKVVKLLAEALKPVPPGVPGPGGLTDCFVSLALRRAAHDCITGDGSNGGALRLC